MPEFELLDDDTIEMLKEVMEDEFKDLIEAFLADAEEKLVDCATTIEAQDSDGLRIAAHSIKGASANLGASHLSESAHEVEVAAKESDFDGAKEKMKQLHEAYPPVKAELEKLMASL